MNRIILRGRIDNIEFSHRINSNNFYKATLSVQDSLDVIRIQFKNKCPYINGDFVELEGSIRSHTEKLADGKNRVNIYVFTQFNKPSNSYSNNYFELDGRVCKTDKIRPTKHNQKHMHIILANNIFSYSGKQKLNNYIPVVGYDEFAEVLSKYKVNDRIIIKGFLHSRPYIKTEDDKSIVKTAYEAIIDYCKEVTED